MNTSNPFNTLLVPTDFSDASRHAFKQSLNLVSGEDALIFVLHVIDERMVDFVVNNEFAKRDDVVSKLRETALETLAEFRKTDRSDVQIDTLVSVGPPFLEIIRKSNDFAVDAIVMGKVGTRGAFEQLLFGSTAEQVLRGTQVPVIVLPATDDGE